MRLLLPPLLATLAACGPTAVPAHAARSDAILGGTPDPVDSDVFLLELHLDGGRTALCSATLISSKILLTAAHCVDPASHGSATLTARAMNKPDDTNLSTSDFIDAAELHLHPQWSAGSPTSGYDLALVLLVRAPANATPRPLSRSVPVQGAPLRVIGYGRTAAGTADSGTRRSANTSITSVTADHLDLGVAGSLGTCVGDSGGPALVTGTDGVERVAGVHSYGSALCGEGSDVRVDRQLAFIDAWLDLKDPALCSADGRCQPTGCTPADSDCVCVADAFCNPACPDLSTDPDCPPDCVQNGVCSAEACPRPDPDCLVDGDACQVPGECLNHQCIADPRGFSFCSRSCTSSGDCSRDMECRETLCRAPLANLTPAGPAFGSCSSAPVLAPLLALAWLRRRRHR